MVLWEGVVPSVPEEAGRPCEALASVLAACLGVGQALLAVLASRWVGSP